MAKQVTKPRAGLTELEGAILGILRRVSGFSAYAVRQVFLSSQLWADAKGRGRA